MWTPLNCCTILVDVVSPPAGTMRRQTIRGSAARELRNNGIADNEDENPLILPKFKRCHVENRFQDLAIGDPSRNVIEMIFRTSLANPRNRSRKVRRVLKVNNSLGTIRKFEEYREVVKKASYSSEQHPRSMVDGNEVRQFYGTAITCCSRKSPCVSQLCRDPACRVCRVIQSGFNTSYHQKCGIQLSMNSDVVSEDVTAISKSRNARKAVIICRTIAGKIADTENDQNQPQSCLILSNPTAVLPCFVVVFD